MDTNLTPTNPEVVAEREAALRRMDAFSRSTSARAPGPREPRRDAARPATRAGLLDVVTPALFASLVAGLFALVAIGATVR